MIHVAQMRDLMRDGGAADMVGGHDEPPAIAQVAARGAASPAAARVADPDASDGQARRRGERAAFALYALERLRLQPAFDPASDRFARPAEPQRVILQPDCSRACRIPVDPALDTEQGNMCVGADSDWRHRLAELRAEPVLLDRKSTRLNSSH